MFITAGGAALYMCAALYYRGVPTGRLLFVALLSTALSVCATLAMAFIFTALNISKAPPFTVMFLLYAVYAGTAWVLLSTMLKLPSPIRFAHAFFFAGAYSTFFFPVGLVVGLMHVIYVARTTLHTS